MAEPVLNPRSFSVYFLSNVYTGIQRIQQLRILLASGQGTERGIEHQGEREGAKSEIRELRSEDPNRFSCTSTRLLGWREGSQDLASKVLKIRSTFFILSSHFCKMGVTIIPAL